MRCETACCTSRKELGVAGAELTGRQLERKTEFKPSIKLSLWNALCPGQVRKFSNLGHLG